MDDDIIRMAREAGWKDLPTVRLAFAGFDLARFAALVRADERKRIKAEPVEPVAWRVGSFLYGHYDCIPSYLLPPAQQPLPLYTAPPQRKPLTSDKDRPDQGATYVEGYGYVDTRAVRAVERAHRIGGQDDNVNS